MTNEELEILKREYEQELNRRTRILELLKNDDVKEFLILSGQTSYLINPLKWYSLEPEDVIREILEEKKKVVLSGSSEIYCIRSSFETKDNEWIKYYSNLENIYDKEKTFAINNFDKIMKFEDEHDVLIRGAKEKAQTDFFLMSFDYGTEYAKKYVLQKYGNRRNIK